MSQKPETRFKNKIRPLLEGLPRTWLAKIQQQTIRGTPDFLLCIGGKFVALELKKSYKEKPDPLQQYTLDKIIEAGGWGIVVSPENWDQIYSSLKELAHAV